MLSASTEYIFVGSPWGMISQTVALDYPGRVASLALVNTTSEYTDDQLQAWRDRAALVRREGMGAVRDGLMARWLTAEAATARSAGYRYMEGAFARFTPEGFDAASCYVRSIYDAAAV